MEKSDIGDWVVSEKDAGLARAIEMIPDRLGELPSEIPHMPRETREIMDLVTRVIARPARFSIVHDVDLQDVMMGYGVVTRIDLGSRRQAGRAHNTIMEMLRNAEDRGLTIDDSEQFEGMSMIETPAGPITFGPHRSNGSWSYDVFIGAVNDPDAGFDTLPEAPDGMSAIVRARLDLDGLNPAADFARAMLGEEEIFEQVFDGLAESGLVGERTIKVDYVAGYTDERAIERTQIIDARHFAEQLGLATETLSDEEIRVVPADATMASIARFDFDQITQTLDMLEQFGVPVEDGLNEFKEQTGVDVRRDILGALGSTVAMYTSDSTGGGSLLSGVMQIGVDDHDRLAGAHAKLAGLVNHLLDDNEFTSRYVSLSSWTGGGQELMSVRFNGLPVPLEVSYALTDDWLILGATPQAVVSAIRQSRGEGDAGLGSNDALRAELPHGRSFTSITYLDTDRLGRQGYPMACLLGSALANGVRSADERRDAGMVVPTFHDLMDGARATVGVTYWDDDRYITEWRADRSMLVQTAVMGGAIGQFMPVVAAATIPGMMAARREAMSHRRWDSMLERSLANPKLLARVVVRHGLSAGIGQRAILGLLSAAQIAQPDLPKDLSRMLPGVLPGD